MLSPKGWLWILALIVTTALYGAHRWVVHSEVTYARDELTLMYNQKMLKAAEKAAITTDELRINANNLEKEKNAKIATINNELDVALKRLRERPPRPPNYTPPSSVTSSCSGRELYQEDGLFLRREASRAEALIEERDYYYNQYEAARKKLNGE